MIYFGESSVSFWEKCKICCSLVNYSVDICQVHLFYGIIHSEAYLFIFCLDDLSIGDSGILKSPNIIVLRFICVFKSISVCLMKMGPPTLGTCN
jgi:hypothetical protein